MPAIVVMPAPAMEAATAMMPKKQQRIGMLSINFVMYNMTLCLHFEDVTFKGSLTRDFRLQAFFMTQFPHGPEYFIGPFQIFTKFESKGQRGR